VTVTVAVSSPGELAAETRGRAPGGFDSSAAVSPACQLDRDGPLVGSSGRSDLVGGGGEPDLSFRATDSGCSVGSLSRSVAPRLEIARHGVIGGPGGSRSSTLGRPRIPSPGPPQASTGPRPHWPSPIPQATGVHRAPTPTGLHRVTVLSPRLPPDPGPLTGVRSSGIRSQAESRHGLFRPRLDASIQMGERSKPDRPGSPGVFGVVSVARLLLAGHERLPRPALPTSAAVPASAQNGAGPIL